MEETIAPQTKRWCCRCQKHLPSDQFHKGNTGYCKACRSAYLRETYKPELVRERNARHYKKRKEKIMSVHQHTIVALAPGKFHCVICEKDLTALDLLVAVDEPAEMNEQNATKRVPLPRGYRPDLPDTAPENHQSYVNFFNTVSCLTHDDVVSATAKVVMIAYLLYGFDASDLQIMQVCDIDQVMLDTCKETLMYHDWLASPEG